MTEETQNYVTSIQEVDLKRRRIYVNYEPAFVLYISELRRFGIKKDAYISSSDYEEIVNILSKRAKIRAMALLKDRDYTRKKLYETHMESRVCVSYSRSSFGMSFENLPLMSIILKKVTAEFPSVIYSIERMTFTEERCVFVLLFSEDNNWVKILNRYESNIEVCREENFMMHHVNSQPVLLDL